MFRQFCLPTIHYRASFLLSQLVLSSQEFIKSGGIWNMPEIKKGASNRTHDFLYLQTDARFPFWRKFPKNFLAKILWCLCLSQQNICGQACLKTPFYKNTLKVNSQSSFKFNQSS